MASVTQRIKQIIQPRGGYINPKKLKAADVVENWEVPNLDLEELSPAMVGLCVDYLTRLSNGTPVETALEIGLRGYSQITKLLALQPERVKQYDLLYAGEELNWEQFNDNIEKYVTNLKQHLQRTDWLTNGSAPMIVQDVLNIAKYDIVYRTGWLRKVPTKMIPDQNSIDHIIQMVLLNKEFVAKFGPVVLDGFTMDGGYTDIIHSGDGDLITYDTLWDIKVSKNPPTKEHTLQILIYYLMGLHSINSCFFRSLNYLGIYNPRLGQVWRIAICDLDKQMLKTVEMDVIGYENSVV